MDNRLKIAVLYDTWEEDEAAPAPERPPTRKRRRKREKPDREEIFDALAKLGHEPSYYVLDGREATLLGLAKTDADLIFNLTESFAGDDTKDMHVAAFLDLLGRPYTGAGPHALYLAQDKALAKKMFAFHGIRTPFFATSYLGKLEHAHDISFPLIVKPTNEDGSIGIDAGSVVESVKELMERIHYIHEKFDSPALIEEYIPGREIYASIIGNGSPEVLPLIELDLSKLPEGTPKIASSEVKWEKDTEAYKVTKSAPVEDLPEEVARNLAETALAAYRTLKLRDYGRIDMRLNKKNEVYVIEANPNPWLSSGAEFAMAARKAGRSYTQLIGEIVELAYARR
ncbi:MAG TPA: ATP-grasp domain-containing protein [Terriglobales bacterium]|nr:ATP-grasp domain-containing protein [Terriglobales bacterium]